MGETNGREEVSRQLRSARLFRGVDDRLLEVLAGGAQILHFEPGEIVWQHGRRAEHLALVLRGILELRRVAKGKEPTLLGLFGPGDAPALPIVMLQVDYAADAVASHRAVDVLRLRAAPLVEHAASDLGLATALSRALLDHVRILHNKIDVVTAGLVPRRLALFFSCMIERYGDEHEGGARVLPMPLSRAQIASYVSARVETVIRCLSAWQKQEKLRTERDGFVFPDVEWLRAQLEPR